MSSASMMMSPILMPIRNWMRRSLGTSSLRNATSRSNSMAHRTASTTLANSAKKPVAGGLHDAPAMLGNLGLGHLPTQCHQGCMRAFLVGTHKPAVARDIGRENGCELPLDPLWAQHA